MFDSPPLFKADVIADLGAVRSQEITGGFYCLALPGIRNCRLPVTDSTADNLRVLVIRLQSIRLEIERCWMTGKTDGIDQVCSQVSVNHHLYLTPVVRYFLPRSFGQVGDCLQVPVKEQFKGLVLVPRLLVPLVQEVRRVIGRADPGIQFLTGYLITGPSRHTSY